MDEFIGRLGADRTASESAVGITMQFSVRQDSAAHARSFVDQMSGVSRTNEAAQHSNSLAQAEEHAVGDSVGAIPCPRRYV